MPTTTNLSESTLSRLPKGVQQEIKRLVGSANYWENKATVGPEDSDTFADRISGTDDFRGRPLGRGVSVVFRHSGDEEDAEAVAVKVVDGAVEVRGAAGNPLIVEPMGSNQLRIRSVNPYRPIPPIRPL